MSYPFTAAKYFTRGGMTEARAILWHMAEGFGTVPWLTHPSGDNSAHFVIEGSGRIVQMVKLTDASHSAHVAIDADDRDADDCGIYSDKVGKAVLGTGWSNINRYVVAVEVEGFRANGPNASQTASIKILYDDLRRRLPTIRGNLGHRDVQDYKSCPGCLFPWSRIGGHGLIAEEEDVPGLTITDHMPEPGSVKVKNIVGVRAFTIGNNEPVPMQPGWVKPVVGKGKVVPPLAGGAPGDDRANVYIIGGPGVIDAVILASQVDFTASPAAAPAPDVVLSPGQLFTVGAK